MPHKRLLFIGVITLAVAGVFTASPQETAQAQGFTLSPDAGYESQFDVLERLPNAVPQGPLGNLELLLPQEVLTVLRQTVFLHKVGGIPATDFGPPLNPAIMVCAVPAVTHGGGPFTGTHSDCKNWSGGSAHSGTWQSENGTDWMSPGGSAVVAIVTGTIETAKARTNSAGCFQAQIYLRGDDNNRYYYQHLDPPSMTVIANQRVVAGEVIAYTNSRPKCSDPHAHIALENPWRGGEDPIWCEGHGYPIEFRGQDPQLDTWDEWFTCCKNGGGPACTVIPPPPPGGGPGGGSGAPGLLRPLPDPFTCEAPDVQTCIEPTLTLNPEGFSQDRCIPIDDTCAQGLCFGICEDIDGNLLSNVGALSNINEDPNPVATLAALDPDGGDYCSYAVSDRCGDPSQGGACAFILECETHNACNAVTRQCELVDGRQLRANEVSCTNDADCQITHNVCKGNQCVLIPGDGADECSGSTDCALNGYDCPTGALTLDECTYTGLTRSACLGEAPVPSGPVLSADDPVTVDFSIAWGHIEGLKINVTTVDVDGTVSVTNTDLLSTISLAGINAFDGGDSTNTPTPLSIGWSASVATDYDAITIRVVGTRDETVSINTSVGSFTKSLREWIAYDGREISPIDLSKELVITAHDAFPAVGPQCATVACTAQEIAAGQCVNSCTSNLDCGVSEIIPGALPPPPTGCPPHDHPNPPYGAGSLGVLEHDGNLGNDDPELVTHFQIDMNTLQAAGIGFSFTCNGGLSGCSGANLVVDGLFGIRTGSAALAYENWKGGGCGSIDGVVDASTWACLAADMTLLACPAATGNVCGDNECAPGEDTNCPVDCVLRRSSPLPIFPHGAGLGGGSGTALPILTCSDTSGDKIFDSCQENGESTILCGTDADCTRTVHSQCINQSCRTSIGPGINACGLPPSALDDSFCNCSPVSTCGGKYDPLIRENPANENFGDSCCDFSEAALFAELKRLDCRYANFWMEIARAESAGTFSPNIVAGSSASGSAWGFFQMGHDARDLNNDGDTNDNVPWDDPRRGIVDVYEGRQIGISFDQGDVPWRDQVINAIGYNNILFSSGRSWCYWATARSRIPGLDAICKVKGLKHTLSPNSSVYPSSC